VFAFIALSCGGSKGAGTSSTSSAISGNWQITLTRHNSTEQWTFSGFLMQSGSTVNGSFVLGVGCQGVGPVTGTIDGQNLQLTVGSFGQDFNLSATLPSGSSTATTMSGQFSTLPGACVDFTSSGTWTAIRIPPLSGSFQGSFIAGGAGGITINVIGTLTQGPNIGASNATLSGTMAATGAPAFCSYIGQTTVTGVISGTSATLNFYGPDGTLIGQAPSPGGAFPPLTVSPDGNSITGSFNFNGISSSCSGFSGGGQSGMTLTFQ
jgi:hypothetical protein